MHSNLLKKQVTSELKKRRYILFTLLLLSLFYILLNLVTGEMSVTRYLELKEKKASLKTEIQDIQAENERLGEAIGSYKDNDFYMEKHAREDFGLAGPDEYIFLYEKDK